MPLLFLPFHSIVYTPLFRFPDNKFLTNLPLKSYTFKETFDDSKTSKSIDVEGLNGLG